MKVMYKIMDKEQLPETNGIAETKDIRLVDLPVSNDNDALNLLVAFVGLAQKRGAFNLEEAGKIWECVKHFRR